MLIVASIFAALAALIHVYIFVLETLRWEAPATRRIFGTTAETAAITKPLAANQGVYNLLLAVVTTVGIILATTPLNAAGIALIAAGTGSMLVAAGYLVITDRSKVRAASVQGAAPVLSLVFLGLSAAA